MADSTDAADALGERIAGAAAAGTPLAIVGGATKSFLGRVVQAEPLAVGAHRGVVSYEPTELVLTARGGTTLADVEATLAGRGQMLPFEPPHFGTGATVGGTVACGLSGPRRPYAGALRDFVLGVRILDGRGQRLAFGGQVMKNVAGYDVSRLMAGAHGTLGVLLEVSLKVLPRPEAECSVVLQTDVADAVDRMCRLAGTPIPLSGAFHDGGHLWLRLSGTANGVAGAAARLGGERVDGPSQWDDLREHRLPFFHTGRPLWRLSVPPATPALALAGDWLVDWGGAQRWLASEVDADAVRAAARTAGGHATLYRGADRTGTVFHPLPDSMAALHGRLKAVFDPHRILNPGRMYEDL